jgi:hypothetical protein
MCSAKLQLSGAHVQPQGSRQDRLILVLHSIGCIICILSVCRRFLLQGLQPVEPLAKAALRLLWRVQVRVCTGHCSLVGLLLAVKLY